MLLYLVPIQSLTRFGVIFDLVISTCFLSNSLISNGVIIYIILYNFHEKNSAGFAYDTPVPGTRTLDV